MKGYESYVDSFQSYIYENNKCYPQVFLGACPYEIKMKSENKLMLKIGWVFFNHSIKRSK